MSEQPDPDRLKALEDKLERLKSAQADEKPHQEEHYSMAQHAWRMVIELVAGLGIGFFMGWGLDAVFGTKPILMVVFTLLGFAAGVKVMIRTAQELQNEKMAADQATDDKRD